MKNLMYSRLFIKFAIIVYSAIWLTSFILGTIIADDNKNDSCWNEHVTYKEFSKESPSILNPVRYVFYLHLPIEDPVLEKESMEVKVLVFVISLTTLILLLYSLDFSIIRHSRYFIWGIILAFLLTLWRVDFYIYYLSNWGFTTQI